MSPGGSSTLREGRNAYAPDFSPGRFTQNGEEVWEILAANPQVKMAIAGHYHFSAVQEKEGVHYFSTPSIITYPLSFFVFKVSKKEVVMERVLVGDTLLRAKAKEELVKAGDWCPHFESDTALVTLFEGAPCYSFRMP